MNVFLFNFYVRHFKKDRQSWYIYIYNIYIYIYYIYYIYIYIYVYIIYYFSLDKFVFLK